MDTSARSCPRQVGSRYNHTGISVHTNHLRAVLDRARGLIAAQPLSDAATNQPESEAQEIITGQIRRVWKAAGKDDITETELITLLKLMHVVVLDVEAGDVAEREALNLPQWP